MLNLCLSQVVEQSIEVDGRVKANDSGIKTVSIENKQSSNGGVALNVDKNRKIGICRISKRVVLDKNVKSTMNKDDDKVDKTKRLKVALKLETKDLEIKTILWHGSVIRVKVIDTIHLSLNIPRKGKQSIYIVSKLVDLNDSNKGDEDNEEDVGM
ncbi:6956_t:CDS:2 [Gigaspora margarita]|uniref:6956_t:CDS:1 n=1 Tax=Gigaspora margarita TaxID=4874 RepID=A0ABM8W499_GIGMA|nr:6956_t:CDS:2 [Gigaspora margarita]